MEKEKITIEISRCREDSLKHGDCTATYMFDNEGGTGGAGQFSKEDVLKLISNFLDKCEKHRIELIEKKSVKDRSEEEHRKLISSKYNNSTRKYLLSMGEFKDVPID